MHEYSIVQALLNQCEEIASQNNAKKITKVVTKIGVLSGVEPHLLEIAFNTFKEDSIAKDAEFIMNIQKLKIRCNNCQNESELNEAHYCCPKCESLEVEVIDGEEMYLMSLEME
jgi:hydrogenase nickel insertion protein HypA